MSYQHIFWYSIAGSVQRPFASLRLHKSGKSPMTLSTDAPHQTVEDTVESTYLLLQALVVKALHATFLSGPVTAYKPYREKFGFCVEKIG